MFSKLVDKLKNKHFLSLAGNGVMAVLSIITYAILYRIMPETDMGNWIFFQFAFALLDAIRTGFLQTAFIKFYAGTDEQRKSSIAGSTWLIAIIITVSLILPNLPSFYFLDKIEDSGILLFLQWYGLSLLLTLPFNVSFWILQAEARFDRILVLRLINQGSFIISIAALFFLHQMNILHLMYAYLGCSLLTSLFSIIAGWSLLGSFRHRTSACTKEIFHFGKFSVGTYLTATVFKYSDAFIIKFMIGPAALAVYNLAVRLLEVIEIPIRSFLATAMPAMSAAFNKNDNKNVITIMKKYTGTLTILLVPVIACMLVVADLVVTIIGGHKYIDTEAANVFRIFMFSAILFPMDRFFGITLDIIHKPQLNLVKIILSLIINIVTDIIAIQLFGNIYGVAVASIFTLLFGVGFGYISLNKYLPYKLNGVMQMGYAESKALMLGFFRKRPVL